MDGNATLEISSNRTALLGSQGQNQSHGQGLNVSHHSGQIEEEEFLFDRLDVRLALISGYTLVFCCSFFGKSLIVLWSTLNVLQGSDSKKFYNDFK